MRWHHSSNDLADIQFVVDLMEDLEREEKEEREAQERWDQEEKVRMRKDRNSDVARLMRSERMTEFDSDDFKLFCLQNDLFDRDFTQADKDEIRSMLKGQQEDDWRW